MIDSAAIRSALHSWLSTATGLPCVWEKQNGLPQPSGAYCTMDLGALARVGGGVASMGYDGGRPAGQEVELSISGTREPTLRVQAFIDMQAGQTGDMAAALLDNAGARLRLPTVRDALRSAGLAVADVGPALNLTGLAGVRWQARATMEVRLRVVESVSERVGYIETAEVSTVLAR